MQSNANSSGFSVKHERFFDCGFNGNPWAFTCNHVAFGDFNRLLVGDKRISNIPDTESGGAKHQNRYDKRPTSPFSHVLLGSEIILAATIFFAGLHCFLYAFRLPSWLHGETGALYAFLGALGMLAGASLGFELMMGMAG